MGELSIVSYFKDSDPFYKGHSFLVYKSYINDILDIHGLTDGYYGTEISCGTVPLYEIDRNNYISFGAWMESIEYDFSNSIPESCITSIPARQNGGIYYNYEAYGMRENHACYLPNAALKQFISFDQLTSLLQFLNTQNWYSVTNHNCATVASKAWNKVTDDHLSSTSTVVFPRLQLGSFNIVQFDSPKKLKTEIMKRRGLPDNNYYVFTGEELITNI